MFSLLTKAYTLVDSQLTDPPAVAQRAENKSRSSMTDEEWLNDWLNNDDFSNFFDEKVRHERTSMDDDFDAAMMHRDNMFDNAMSPLYDNHEEPIQSYCNDDWADISAGSSFDSFNSFDGSFDMGSGSIGGGFDSDW